MSADKFSKHQRSKYQRYVATYSNGDKIQADTKEELQTLMDEKVTNGSKSQLFDPETGKPIE